jgi:TRIAD3 protein (E3 ubiquitin-protein ligase RNF216)
MDQSGCKEEFPEVELQRLLPDKLWQLYHRIKQGKEIAAAGLDGLEECPFCDFKIVIENVQEKLFRCHNDECLAVTCRTCKKPVGLPLFTRTRVPTNGD